MYKDENKQILISISSDSYMSKDDSKSAVTYRMTWTPQNVTMGKMLEYCMSGHTFCNQFCDDKHEIFKKPFNSTFFTTLYLGIKISILSSFVLNLNNSL